MKTYGRKIWPLILVFFVALSGCRRDEKGLLEDLLAVEEESYRDSEISEKTVDELQEAIKLLKNEVERTVEAGIRLAVYYKMVAQKYMEQELYGLAADFYAKTLEIHPTNKLVAYRLGICTAQMVRAVPDADSQKAGFERALGYHLYALELDPSFEDALYAVSVLYIFELDAIADAETHLEKLLSLDPGHINGMFLLARVYAHYGRIEDAISLYDEIIRSSNNEPQIEQAKKNRAALAGGINGN